MAARVFRAASLLFALQGCEDPSAPELPDGAVPLEPLAPYRTWWNLVQACSNLTGSYAAIRWYSAPQVSAADSTVRALWTEAGNRIVVRTNVIQDGRVVRHEMLHALLRRSGHPPEYFANRCADLVSCEHGCAPPEGDRGVAPDAAMIPPYELTVTATLEPRPPNEHTDAGWFRIRVTATNPRNEPVWVTAPDGNTFGLAEDRSPPVLSPYVKPRGTLLHVPALEGRWAFRAGEQRSTTFDVQWPAGTSEVRIAFSLNEKLINVVVRP